MIDLKEIETRTQKVRETISLLDQVAINKQGHANLLLLIELLDTIDELLPLAKNGQHPVNLSPFVIGTK